MQKKLIVLAVSGALGVPLAAFAQSNISIYGRANMGLDRYSATGASLGTANFASRMRIYDSGSRLGFRGTEDLGGGMQAYFQLETGVNWDSGTGFGQSGTNNAGSTGFPASRDSFLGIKAGWGEISFGRQSIFWANGLNAQTGANYANASADGLLTGLQLVAAPFTRQSNVVYYTSPRMAGIDVAVAFTPHTQEPATYTGTGQAKGSGWGANLKYRLGGLYLQLDHAVNKNKANVSGATDSGDKIGVSYGYMPGSRVAFIYQRLKNKGIAAAITGGNGVIAAAGDTLTNNMMGVNWEHSIGPLALYLGYFRGGDVKGGTAAAAATGGTKSVAYHFGAKHHLSKRTGVYGTYNVIRNEANAFADLTGGGYTSAGNPGMPAVSSGADVKAIGFGIMHNF